MDTITEIFTSKTFLYVAPIIIGILFSWYIAKHFFLKKAPSPITLAKKQKTTDFGNNRNLALENQEIVIDHELFGKWISKSDGTVTNTNNKLMWIRSPWGTTWDGTHFIGEPIRVNWRDATHLFGQGVYIKGVGASLPTTHLENTSTTKNYKKGICTVNFAGHQDWRLPTAYELNTLGFYTSSEISEAYSRSGLDAPKKLREQLFPGLQVSSDNYNLWSADEAGSACAWAADGSWPLGDFKFSTQFFVLLVRST